MKHFCLLPVLLLAFIFGQSQTRAELPIVQADSATLTIDTAYIDSLINAGMKNLKIPGAVIVITDKNNILFTRGYGYSDVSKRTAFDPSKTIFRIASVSKVVLSTVVLQCVEKGLLDLNGDINDYLKGFTVPPKYPGKITLANLLTHSGGFDDFMVGQSTRNEADIKYLGEFLKKNLPARVFPSGIICSYSNYGMALAGYLAEEATGKDFSMLADSFIFRPLGMKSSGFLIPDSLKPFLTKGYLNIGKIQKEFPFDYLRDYPSGQMVTTATDFARFMICHLNEGNYQGTSILSQEAVRDMHLVHFTQNPVLSKAMGWGFEIDTLKGNVYLVKGGGYPGTSTFLALAPDNGIGVFIATNIASGGFTPGTAFHVLDHMIPVSFHDSLHYPLASYPLYDRNTHQFTGMYRNTRYCRHSITKIGVLLGISGPDIRIWRNELGMILMYDLKHKARRLIQVKPNVFRSIDDRYYIAFQEDPSGKVKYLFTNGITSFEKIPWFFSILYQRILFFICILVFILCLIWSMTKTKKTRRDITYKVSQKIKHLSGWTSGVFLFYYLCWGILCLTRLSIADLVTGLGYGVPRIVYAIQCIPILGIVLFGFYLYFLLLKSRKCRISLFMRFRHFLFTIVTLAYIGFIGYWNILGFIF
ncbi:MAG: serine hydrolase domain-containing protein [Bacteroidota bacterium]|nr:serine hydrolase domain-containing protein [Bacteroidota bacterium]